MRNSTWMHRIVETASLTAFAGAWGLLLARTLRAFDGLALEWVPAIVLAGLLTADFTSGMIHFLADNFGSPTTAYFGPAFIRPFREHHSDPAGITRHGFVELNGNAALSVLAVTIPAALLPTPAPLGLFLLVYLAATVFTNTFHRWTHMEHPPRLAARLQRWGVLLHGAEHGRHHAPPHDSRYCITLGWLNPILDRARFFARLGRGLRRMTGPPTSS